jgi:threonine dehydratase
VIAGQGTCGLEIAEQAKVHGITTADVLTNCGGGGLTSGIALALEADSPGLTVRPCEPEGFDDTARSLASGQRESNAPGARSICDALMSPTPGELTFALNSRLLSGGLAVTDDEVRAAMAYAFRSLKLVVEPGGAVCLAAVLTGKLALEGRSVALTLSGGNVDPAVLATALDATPI